MPKLVKYGDYQFAVRRDDIDIHQIQDSLSDIFPELKDAYVQDDGDVVTFTPRPKYVNHSFNHFYSYHSNYDGVIIDNNKSALVLLNKNEEWY